MDEQKLNDFIGPLMQDLGLPAFPSAMSANGYRITQLQTT